MRVVWGVGCRGGLFGPTIFRSGGDMVTAAVGRDRHCEHLAGMSFELAVKHEPGAGRCGGHPAGLCAVRGAGKKLAIGQQKGGGDPWSWGKQGSSAGLDQQRR